MLVIIFSSIARASKPTGAAVDGCVRAFSESPDTRTTKSVSNTKATEQRSDEKIMKQWSLNKYERCTSLLLQRNIISLQMLRSTVEKLRRAVASKLRLVAANSCQLLHSITNARRMDETLSGSALVGPLLSFAVGHPFPASILLRTVHIYGVVQWSRLIWRIIIVLLFALLLLFATKEFKYRGTEMSQSDLCRRQRKGCYQQK